MVIKNRASPQFENCSNSLIFSFIYELSPFFTIFNHDDEHESFLLLCGSSLEFFGTWVEMGGIAVWEGRWGKLCIGLSFSRWVLQCRRNRWQMWLGSSIVDAANLEPIKRSLTIAVGKMTCLRWENHFGVTQIAFMNKRVTSGLVRGQTTIIIWKIESQRLFQTFQPFQSF